MKIKVITIIVSTSILLLILSFDNHLEIRRNVINYKQLEWSDFDGYPKLFSEFEAEIYTNIQVRYDSILGRYAAYSIMNRNKSWVNSLAKDSEELLRHEQYHFDITNYFAKKLDRIIVDEGHKYRSSIEFELQHTMNDLIDMQKKYDRETDHSIIESEQRGWEYKIDSMLLEFEEQKGFVNDPYSSGQVFLNEVEFSVEYDTISEDLKRYYFSESYGMYRTLTSVNYNYYGEELTGLLADAYEKDKSLELLNIENKEVDGLQEIHIKLKDTTNDSYHIERRVYANRKSYIIKAVYYEGLNGTKGYEAIANSFIQSFKIKNNDKYWMDLFERDTSNQYVSTTLNTERKSELITAKNCIKYFAPSYVGFISQPIELNDGSSIIPYYLPRSMRDEIADLVLSFGGIHHVFELDTTEVIFHFPYEALKKDLTVGYTLKKDSLQECTPIYFDTVE